MARRADSLVDGLTELSSSVFAELPIRTGDWTVARTSRLDNLLDVATQHRAMANNSERHGHALVPIVSRGC
jgi:hypothetical protein